MWVEDDSDACSRRRGRCLCDRPRPSPARIAARCEVHHARDLCPLDGAGLRIVQRINHQWGIAESRVEGECRRYRRFDSDVERVTGWGMDGDIGRCPATRKPEACRLRQRCAAWSCRRRGVPRAATIEKQQSDDPDGNRNACADPALSLLPRTSVLNYTRIRSGSDAPP